MTTSEKKKALARLRVLELAEKLGNVSEACRQRGMSRPQFYEYKRRLQIYGLDGLVELPPIHKTHPQTTPPEVVEKIYEYSLHHPGEGANRISNRLKSKGISVSGPTIQKILAWNGMGSKYQRLSKRSVHTINEYP